MRISDWSSDVCSSDLREPRAGTDDLVVAHLRRKLRQGGRLGNLCLRARGIGFGEQALALRAARKRLIKRAGRIGVRSEEHTSELQSLMRISYAVFCLKKKKTYKTIIRQTYTRLITQEIIQ